MAWWFPRKFVFGTVFLIFALDFLLSVVIFFSGRSADADNSNFYEVSTTDTLLCFLVRAVLFPLLTFGAFFVYNRTANSSPLKALQREETETRGRPQQERQQRHQGCGDEELSSMRTPLTGASQSLPDTVSDAGSTTATERTGSETESAAPGVGLKNEKKALFEIQQSHALLMKKANFRRNLVMGVLFCLCVAMSIYGGLKCVNFHYSQSFVVLEAAMLFAIIICINLEYFMLQDLLKKLTEEKGELISHLHMHPLFFETGLKCHQCDVCSETTKAPHYVAYRCRTCDFDLCPRCYNMKDKPTARGHGLRAIRKDGEQITTWTFFKRIIGLAGEFWQTTAFSLTCLVCAQMLQIWAPNIQGHIFDSIIQYLHNPEGNGREEFTRAMVTYTVVNFLQGTVGGLKVLSLELVMRNLACSSRLKLFQSVIRMDISFFDAMHSGQLTSRLTNDASAMISPLSTLMNDLLANVILLLGGTVMAFRTSWKLSILAITVVPPITYCYRMYAAWGRRVNRSIYCAYGEANSTATDAIHNIRTVRGFSTEQHETQKYEESIGTALGHGVRNAKVGASVNAFSTYMNLGTAVLILWYGGGLVCDSGGKAMSVGSLLTFQLYWNMMNGAFISLGNVFNDLIRSSSAAERVFSIIDAKPDVDPDAGDPVDPDEVKGHLELLGVEFRYKTRAENLVLRKVDLSVSPGTTTALVGKSGGGKSTLVHLLMRFYEPTAGAIMLDGRDVATLSSKSLRKCCGFVAQDTQLFACSIEDNLAYGLGRPYTHEELVAACEAANAHDFIMEMDEQYQTRAGEKGVMLSGGQKQRLAIARSFLRKPRLLFLDEATSALDAENEALVQHALDTLIQQSGCTVVLIAHRLSTVINSHQIAVVHRGKIVERGSHDDLLREGGIYAQLVQRQVQRDASSLMEEKGENGKNKVRTIPKTVQNEIDALIEEVEATGGLNLDP